MSDVAPPDADAGPDPAEQDASMGSRQTVASWPPIVSDPALPKRVCFYKSGDPQFPGLRVIISGRTFKTFDALLDNLSKKVPLPFGVRNITTPRGTHAVLSLEELEDGKSYLCSDRKKVKPIKLENAGKKPAPWKTARPVSRGRRMLQPAARAVKRDSSLGARLPKTLIVFKNGDPGIRHTVLLQATNSQTFQSVLALVSEALQFPVVKLYTTDGRRVEGLASLLLHSTGMVVASGHEPFRPDSYHLQNPPPPMRSSSHIEPNRLQPRTRKSDSVFRSSRNFSPSSERFFVNHLNGSMSGSLFDPHSNPLGSMDTATPAGSGDVAARENGTMVPPDDDIEKSFRINQDGSMTVEMKVRLMIKEEETIHWTTTLSRSSTASQAGVGPSPRGPQESGSPDSNCSLAEDPSDGVGRRPEVRLAVAPTEHENASMDGEDTGCATGAVTETEKLRIRRRAPTPGPRAVREEQPSAESDQTAEVQKNVSSADSYVGQTAGGAMSEKQSWARQCSGQPIPKPRSAMSSTVGNHSEVHSAFRSSRSAEILQIQNNGREITESVMHIYQQQSCFDTYFGNSKVSEEHQSVSRTVHSRTVSTDTGPCSSSNDNDGAHRKPSLSSESPTSQMADCASPPTGSVMPSYKIRNDLSSFTDNEARNMADSPSEISPQETDCSEGLPGKSIPRGKRKSEKPKVKKKTLLLPLTPDGTHTEGLENRLKGGRRVKSSSDIASHRESGIRVEHSREGTKNDKTRSGKVKKKKKETGGDTINKSPAVSLNIEHSKESAKELNIMEDNGRTDEIPFSTDKNLLDVQPSMLVRKMLVKQRSMNEDVREAKETREMSESLSLPVLHCTPSVNEYVENWLEKMQPDAAPCAEEVNDTEPEAKVLFRIGSDSPDELDAKSDVNSVAEDCQVCQTDVTNQLTPHAPTEGTFRLGSGHELHARKILGISKSTTCIKSAIEVPKVKMHMSAETLPQSEPETTFTSRPAAEPKLKPLLRQLCLSIRSISNISQRRQPSLEKSHSVPDFSSQVASTFGSSSKMLVAFLSVMSLKDGISSLRKDQSPAKGSSGSEAYNMVTALHKLANIDNTDKLKASLTDLHGSASSQLLQSWKSFQELSSHADSQEHNSEHASQSEASLEFDGHPYGFQDLMEELGISGDLQRELSCLVTGEKMNDVNRNEELMEKSEEANSFAESATKEDMYDFAESVRGIDVNDFAQSVVEDELTEITESVVEDEINNLTQTLKEKEVDNREESTEEEADGIVAHSIQGKEVHNQEESILEEEDDVVAQSVLETEVDKSEESILEEEDYIVAHSVQGEGKNPEAFIIEEEDSIIANSTQGEEADDPEGSIPHEADELAHSIQGNEDEESVQDKEYEDISHSVQGKEVGYPEESTQEHEDALSVQREEDDNPEESNEDEEDGKVVHSVQGKEVNNQEESILEEEDDVVAQSLQGNSIDNLEESILEEEDNNFEESNEDEDGIIAHSVHGKEVNNQEESILEEEDDIVAQSLQENEINNQEESILEEEDDVVAQSPQGNKINNREESILDEDADVVAHSIQGKEDENPEEWKEDDTDADSVSGKEVNNPVIEEEDEVEHSLEGKSVDNPEQSIQDEEDGVFMEGSIKEEEDNELTQSVHETEVNNHEDSFLEEEVDDFAQTVLENRASGPAESSEDNDPVESISEDDERTEHNIPRNDPTLVSIDEDSEQQNCSTLEEANYLERGGNYDAESVNSAMQQEEGSNMEDKACFGQMEMASEVLESDDGCNASNCKMGIMENDSQVRSKFGRQKVTNLNVSREEAEFLDYGTVSRCVEIPENLLGYVSSVLMSSSLAFCYDSKGNLRIEPEYTCFESAEGAFAASGHSQYGQTRLPSPNTSDLSDYRAETTESERCSSKPSVDLSTESEGEYSRGQPITQGFMDGFKEGHDTYFEVSEEEADHADSLSPDLERTVENDGRSYPNTRDSFGQHGSSPKRAASYADDDLSDGVLIDKGRWLLKENHLIRKSPPVPSGMYGAADTTSVDTLQDDASDDLPYSHPENHHSPMAVISSSELEELARPVTPKCTYFNMPHGSDSEPFQDELSVSSKKSMASSNGTTRMKKEPRVCPSDEPGKMWAKKRGSLSSFASVEFKMADNKVHPQTGPSVSTPEQTQPARAAGATSRSLREQDSTERFHLVCGQHCPIL